MLKLADLTPQALAKIQDWTYDEFLEKHEGGWEWGSHLQHEPADFIEVAGRAVLLPTYDENVPNISILECIPSADDRVLTIFLKDTTYDKRPEGDIFNGRLAICRKVEGEDFYVATVFHEWFRTSPHFD